MRPHYARNGVLDIMDSWNEKGPILRGGKELAELEVRTEPLTEEALVLHNLSLTNHEDLTQFRPFQKKRKKGRF